MDEEAVQSLEIILRAAVTNHNNNNTLAYKENLSTACSYINDCIENSSNIAKDAWMIERACLRFDRNIRLPHSTDKTDSRIASCLSATKDLYDLQDNPKKYAKEFLDNQPDNINAKTTYENVAIASMKYLSTIKNVPTTNDKVYEFYETRQDMMRAPNTTFVIEKKQAFEKFNSPKKSNTNTITKSTGLEI